VESVLVTVGAALIVLGVLIFVHELGHFLAAKAVGIAVLRFSFGLGPRTPIGFRIGETDYCLSWIPFGGFVKMAGLEDEPLEGQLAEASVPHERTFDAKPLWARILVISGGVVMNAAFAVVVYAVLAGVYGASDDRTTTVGEVRLADLPMGAAPLATLRSGDRIVRIDGDTVRSWRDVQEALLTTERTPFRIEIAGRTEPVLVDVPLSDQEGRGKLLLAVAPWHEPVLGDVLPDRPAASAGLRVGDRVLRAGSDTVRAWEQLVGIIEANPGRPIPLLVGRGGGLATLTVTPRAERDPARNRVVGKIGAGLYIPRQRFGAAAAIGRGFSDAAASAGIVVFTIKSMILGRISARDLGGPILVGQLSGEAARLGIQYFLGFMALFSMNLAVLNLLPIPVLDGGHLVFLFIEGVRRRPLTLRQRQVATQIGLFVLVGIMLLALSNDVLRLFR
jgi:regulator of sigma E protease